MNGQVIKSWLLNKELVADTISWYIAFKKLIPHYGYLNTDCTKRGIVYMADGCIIHGGLSDRLRGMVSLYAYCKENNIPYYINHINPFNIKDYFMPNVYNWVLNKEHISYNKVDAKPCLIRPIGEKSEDYFVKRLSSNFIKKQLHVYTNVTYRKQSFKENFQELFRPSPFLQNAIDCILSEIGDNYVSITFRFQQLLGDFKEGSYKTLDDKSKVYLIHKCLCAVKKVFNENRVEKILVTSDSKIFLEHAQKSFDYVVTVPGEVRHVDYTNDKHDLAYLKSFTDLYVISKAKKVYFYSTGDMYHNSGFAETGAMIGGKEYFEIIEK